MSGKNLDEIPEDLKPFCNHLCQGFASRPDEVWPLIERIVVLIKIQYQLDTRVATLRKAAVGLVDKLDVVMPLIDNYVVMHTLRTGHQYDGPTIEHELKTLKALLYPKTEGS